MELRTFLLTYWAQITLVIAALGYLLKVILDYKYKKKEIWHSVYQQKKIDYLLKYWEQYYKVESEILGVISLCKRTYLNPSEHSETDVLEITLAYRTAGQLLSQLRLFINESEYKVLNSQLSRLGESLQKLIELLRNEYQDKREQEKFDTLYEKTLASIRENNSRILRFKK